MITATSPKMGATMNMLKMQPRRPTKGTDQWMRSVGRKLTRPRLPSMSTTTLTTP